MHRVHELPPGSVIEAADANPKTRCGNAKVPLHLIPAKAKAHVALAFADGGYKYQPFNWRAERISSSVYYAAAVRHLDAWWEGEEYPEDGEAHHLAHAAACMLMLLDTMGTGLLNDNRPPPSNYIEVMAGLKAKLHLLADRPETKYDLHDIAKERSE